jgi:hypothetical protein
MGPFVPPGSGGLAGIREALFTSTGKLLAVGAGTGTNDKVFQFDGTTGAFLGVFAAGNGLDVPIGLAQGPDNNVYVASVFGSNVKRFDVITGTFVDDFIQSTAHDFPAYIGFTPFPIPEPTGIVLTVLPAGAALARLLRRSLRGEKSCTC